jgi:hypothetical protein
MKTIQNNIFKLCLLVLLGFTYSCETTELEILNDPDLISPTDSDLNFFVNSNLVTLGNLFEGLTEPGMETTRLLHMFGPLYQDYGASVLDFEWSETYSTILSNNRVLEPLAESLEAYQHLGISQIVEAYAITSLVDYVGDIPYSEAVAGIANPSRDPGDEIYGAMLTLLDDAIVNLNKTSAISYNTDIFYGGDNSKWIKLANTLKLKLYVQSRLLSAGESSIVNSAVSTAGINAIIASGNYIASSADDFQFNWSTTDNNPDSRHPIFARNFDSPGVITDYMSNHLMTELNAGVDDKTVVDPRLRYYIYRQGPVNASDTNLQDCFGTLPPEHYGFSIPFCSTDFPGYWGRDHGDNGGIPPDTGSRATWGVYPVGGKFDDNSYTPITSRAIGNEGAGISPIMLASYVDFMLAESALTLGTTGNALSYLTDGISKSMNKVIAFGSAQANGTGFEATQAEINDYIDQITINYNNATSNDERLNIIMTEYQLALFGNGVEAYNSYRRTGMPNDLQPLRVAPVDNFLRSFLYPNVSVTNNANSDQKDDVKQQVFWDNNPTTGFIN